MVLSGANPSTILHVLALCEVPFSCIFSLSNSSFVVWFVTLCDRLARRWLEADQSIAGCLDNRPYNMFRCPLHHDGARSVCAG
jgi:hypothetical protein